MARAYTEMTFTPTVRAVQEQMGTAGAYSKLLGPESDRNDALGENEAAFVAARDGFYQASVTETGWPYVQFRGGPVGFLKVLDARTLAYADFRGNRQYLSVGNLLANNRVSLFLMDYPHRRRLKILGRARFVGVGEDPDLVARLHDPSYRAVPERAVVITVEAWDWNCPQHIPQRLTLEELEDKLAPVRAEMARLRAENEAMKAELGRG